LHLGYHDNVHHFEFYQHAKSFHTLQWIFLRCFMKFDERNKKILLCYSSFSFFLPSKVCPTHFSEMPWSNFMKLCRIIQKLPHTTVDIPTKFHEVLWKESNNFLNHPFFVSMATAAKFIQPIRNVSRHMQICIRIVFAANFMKFYKNVSCLCVDLTHYGGYSYKVSWSLMKGIQQFFKSPLFLFPCQLRQVTSLTTGKMESDLAWVKKRTTNLNIIFL
jgi:hypothetical protein